VSEAAAQNLAGEGFGRLGAVISDVSSDGKRTAPTTSSAEQLSGRFAMLGLAGTARLELIQGHPVVQMVGLR